MEPQSVVPPVQDPAPPTTPASFAPKRPPKVLYLLGGVATILLVIVGAISFFGGGVSQTPTGNTGSQNGEAVANPDYPKYRNATYFYELGLPKKWVEIKHSPTLANIALFDIEGSATLEITALKTIDPLDTYLATQDEAHKVDIKSNKVSQVKVGEHDAIERDESWLTVGLQVTATYVKIQDMLYTFTLIPAGGKNSVTNESIIRDYRNSLATFRLTDTSKLGLDLKEYTSQKIDVLAYPSFSFKYPQSWVVKDEFVGKDTLITSIYRNNYEIRITQAPVGGAVCLFKDSPDFQGSSGDLRNKEFTEFNTVGGIIMRRYFNVNEGDKSTIFFCQKGANSPYFETPTSIGGIAYYVPAKFDTNIINEMDEIIKSLTPVVASPSASPQTQ